MCFPVDAISWAEVHVVENLSDRFCANGFLQILCAANNFRSPDFISGIFYCFRQKQNDWVRFE